VTKQPLDIGVMTDAFPQLFAGALYAMPLGVHNPEDYGIPLS
jgi:hypothetical protein